MPLQLLQALARSLGVYYNSSGSSVCLNISEDATSSLGERGWDFQVSYSLAVDTNQCVYFFTGVY